MEITRDCPDSVPHRIAPELTKTSDAGIHNPYKEEFIKLKFDVETDQRFKKLVCKNFILFKTQESEPRRLSEIFDHRQSNRMIVLLN